MKDLISSRNFRVLLILVVLAGPLFVLNKTNDFVSNIGRFSAAAGDTVAPASVWTQDLNRNTIRTSNADQIVGIGTSAPGLGKLQVDSSVANNNVVAFRSTAPAGSSYGPYIAAGSTVADRAFLVKDKTETKDFFAIDGIGNLGIGTSQFLASSPTPHIELKASYPSHPGFIVLINSNKADLNVGSTVSHYGNISASANESLQQQGLSSVYWTDSTGREANYRLAVRLDDGTNSVAPPNAFTLTGIGTKGGSSRQLAAGVGTQAPEEPLHIITNLAGTGIRLERTKGTLARYGLAIHENGDFSIDETGLNNPLWIKKTSGNIGLGTTNPTTKLQVVGDVSISQQGKGLILKATNGDSCFRVTVDNTGQLSTSPVSCP